MKLRADIKLHEISSMINLEGSQIAASGLFIFSPIHIQSPSVISSIRFEVEYRHCPI